MQVVRSVRLWMKEGGSDKLYEVDLVDLERADNDARYLVNFRYGRRGTSLRDGTKTTSPVTRANAEKLFDSVVVSKINGGYRRNDGDAPPLNVRDAGVDANGRDAELLRKLAVCAPKRVAGKGARPPVVAPRRSPAGVCLSPTRCPCREDWRGACELQLWCMPWRAGGGADAFDVLRRCADVNASLADARLRAPTPSQAN